MPLDQTSELQFLPELPDVLNFEPVVEQQMRNGSKVEGHFWTVNPLTDRVIGTSKTRHKPRNFVEMWNSLDAGLAASDLDVSDCDVHIHDGPDGATMRASVVLKRYDFERVVGEPTKLLVKVADSHNQTVQRVVKALLYRLWCENGQSSIHENIGFSQKHTINQDPIKLGEVASSWPEKLMKEAALHAKMRTLKVSDETTLDFFTKNIATSRGVTGVTVNKQALKETMEIWKGYRSLGPTVFRIYNTLTHISSHVEAKTKGTNLHRKIAREEQRIEEVLRGNDFQKLLAA
tara:strand:+ start:3646 stop:4515 length:870 start_codon:yes stop_codon:yes gene_type:complete